MQIASSALDVRRASEQLTLKEIEEFARNATISEVCSPTTPVEPTGVWRKCRVSVRATTYRNLLGVTVSFFFCFSSYVSLLSLQSSLNSDEGLGLASLITLGVLFSFGVFFSPSLLSLLGTKRSIICGYVAILVYTLCNYYPSWYTLIPGSGIGGFGAASVLWTGAYTHINSVAIKSALSLNEDPKYLISLFTGVFTLFYKAAYLPGNTVSSVVFFNSRPVNTSIVEGNSSCNNMEAANLDELYVYIMLSVFAVFDVVGIAIVSLFVDELGTKRNSIISCKQFLKHHFVAPAKSVVKVMISCNMILLTPSLILGTVSISFMQGLYAKVYVSDCIGVTWVGLVLMTYGVCSGVGGFVSGRMVKHVPQHFITYSVLVIYLAVLLFLLSWQPAPVHYVLFIVAGIFGVGEGALFCVTASLSVILYPDQREAAFSVNRFWHGLGYAVVLSTAFFLSERMQLWLMMAELFISALTYSIVILKTSDKSQLLPCRAQNSFTLAESSEKA